MKNSPANIVTVHKFTNIYFFRHPYSYSTVWIMKICYGVMAQITHFRFLRISPLIFATVQKFALDYLRDQQILTPPCEWGLAVVVPLLGKTLEVEDSPGMVWFHIIFIGKIIIINGWIVVSFQININALQYFRLMTIKEIMTFLYQTICRQARNTVAQISYRPVPVYMNSLSACLFQLSPSLTRYPRPSRIQTLYVGYITSPHPPC